MHPLRFDDRGAATLDGAWDFLPGDRSADGIDAEPAAAPIAVPGLWEAQGHVDLDGVAWYRRRFHLDDPSGHWTLRFGAVMDFTDVYVNGRHVGGHELAFTPLAVDPGDVLVPGMNTLAVRVVDPALGDPDHERMAHGKQGWANHVFPSRPSLYLTYGGIWQPVTLRRHGPQVVTDVFVNADPADLIVTAEIENRGPATTARVSFRTLGLGREQQVDLPAGGLVEVRAGFGAVDSERAPRWSPDAPALHDLVVDLWSERGPSDSQAVRYGLRTIRLDGKRLLLNGEPYRMRSALVQGFTADGLYVEGTTEEIRAEIAAARAMGFNTLRLHIKAFDPRYLDVCDEAGMLLHCDIPVAEPIAHEEMGGDSTITRRCLAAARAQVRRDRNHPSVVLWSAMNEICDGRREARSWPAYEEFARLLYRAVDEEDGTRPIIENDWIEPDPDEVYESSILTAHWYGRLHRDYLDKLSQAAARWEGSDRALLVTEFGDWGLPDMPVRAQPPFWDLRDAYAASLAETLWPATIGRFVLETQRYQGLSDRLQGEVFRRHDGIGGYCVTELTDVPIELNGLLDLDRRPKRLACAELARLNQAVLPMLNLRSHVVHTGHQLRAPLHVANDGPALAGVTVEARFGESASAAAMDDILASDTAVLPADSVAERFVESVTKVFVGDLPAHAATAAGDVSIVAPDVPGNHDLVLRLRAGDVAVAENRYPIHVVAFRPAGVAVRRLAADGPGTVRDPTADALAAAGASIVDEADTAVVGEGMLGTATSAEARRILDRGGTVLVLAQPTEAAAHYPVTVRLEALETAWGSTVFSFTTDHGALPSLPRRNVLAAEDATISALSVVAAVGDAPFPDTPVVIAYKPVPNAVTGTVIGAHQAGAGRIVFCQYRVAGPAAAGDPAARSILADLLRWVAAPRPVMSRRKLEANDRWAATAYAWTEAVAR